MRQALIFAGMFTLLACGSAGDYEDLSDYEGEEFAGESYEEFDERRDSYEGSRGSFRGYGCTEDCGGHEAGYAWAEENGIEDPGDCGGNSWSFEEGCIAYAEDQAEY